jgi:histidinol-phosphate phosphatase family protein
MLTEAGFGVIIITNQACIAKGRQTEEGLAELHEFMLDGIREAGGNILHIYHCPHQTPDNCSCRKPEPGLLLQAAADYDISLENTFFIGDTARDMETAQRVGAKKILIVNDVNAYQPVEDIEADFRASDLPEAALIVISETTV